MDWKEHLQKGKFRDADFLFESSDGELGRRVVLHEYPLRDKPYAEDLGRKARKYTLEIFVLGPNYMAARDKLIGAFEQPGPGTLVHPYLGALSVVAESVRGPRESTREGGMARFSVTFAESGEKLQPKEKNNTAEKVKTAADKAKEEVKEDFEENYDLEGQPDSVLVAAFKMAKKAFSKLLEMKDKLNGYANKLAEFKKNVEAAVNEISALIRAPGQFAAKVMGFVNDLKRLPGKIDAAFDMYTQLFDTYGDDLDEVPKSTAPAIVGSNQSTLKWENDIRSGRISMDTLPKGSTLSRIRQGQNQNAMVNLIKNTAIIEAAQVSAQIDYSCVADATATLEALTQRLDTVIESEETPDSVFHAFSELKAAVVEDIQVRAQNMARIITYTPSTTLPALVVAHTLFGDADKEHDIIERNRIKHPGFIPGGKELEVKDD